MNSKPVNATSIGNESAFTITSGLSCQSVMHSTEKVTSRMWPASMLAKSRTASENGRMRKVERNSIGVTSRYRALGTPGGNRADLK